MVRRFWQLVGCYALAALMSSVLPLRDARAGYSMCAFRQGAGGPCTCKSETDGPGQFSVVAKRHCQPHAAGEKGGRKDPGTAAHEATTSGAEAPVDAHPAPRKSPPDTSMAKPSDGAMPSSATAAGTSAAGKRKLDEVRARGVLRCGVNTALLGFSSQTGAGIWTGLDADFCRAVATAALGDPGKVEFVTLQTSERFDALKSGNIDVLSRNTTWNMSRDVEMGFAYAGVLYFDGQGFMTTDERGLVSAQQLSGAKVCVEAGTTSERNMAFYFAAQQIKAEVKVAMSRDEALKSYLDGACDALTGDRSALFSARAAFADPEKHTVLPEIISKEPLGPLVLKGDDEWADIVRWTLAGLINAEESGLNRASAAATLPLTDDAQRLVEGAGVSGGKLRLAPTWLRGVVAAVGHYGEMFEANVGKGSALGMTRGMNALWKRGGIMFAPPMW